MHRIEIFKNHLSRELDGKSGKQYEIATTRTNTGFRRVKGAAGTGKSLAIVARAAMLGLEGKSVLVTCYTKTLPNYLRSLYKNFEKYDNRSIPGVEFINFHRWGREVCASNGFIEEFDESKRNCSDENEFWDSKMPELVSDIYENRRCSPFYYDAILVDEGQTFEVSWWTTLKKAVLENGEMLLVADKTQDIHGKAHLWTEETMLGLDCGFSGPWFSLSENGHSYRLPKTIIPILKDYLVRYPISVEQDPPSSMEIQDNLFDKYRWVQVPKGVSIVDTCITEIEELRNNSDIPSVFFILKEKAYGKLIAKGLREKGNHVFDTYTHNIHKTSFEEGRAKIMMTTMHSIVGWEASHLIVYIKDVELDKSLFYTALSRLQKRQQGCALTIVCSCPKLEDFGRKHFKDFNMLSSLDDILF